MLALRGITALDFVFWSWTVLDLLQGTRVYFVHDFREIICRWSLIRKMLLVLLLLPIRFCHAFCTRAVFDDNRTDSNEQGLRPSPQQRQLQLLHSLAPEAGNLLLPSSEARRSSTTCKWCSRIRFFTVCGGVVLLVLLSLWFSPWPSSYVGNCVELETFCVFHGYCRLIRSILGFGL